MLRLNATTKNPENIIKITQILQILINHGLNMHYVNMFGQNIADYVQIFGWNDTSVQSIIVGVVPTGIINENGIGRQGIITDPVNRVYVYGVIA